MCLDRKASVGQGGRYLDHQNAQSQHQMPLLLLEAPHQPPGQSDIPPTIPPLPNAPSNMLNLCRTCIQC